MGSPHAAGARSQFLPLVCALSSRWERFLIVLILCAAAALRLWNLSGVPPGLTHDEAAHGQDALRILDGARPIYQTVGYGREPLYDYVLAAGVFVGGPSLVILRVCSVAAGMVGLVATYAWVRLAFGVPTALLAAAFQSVSFWSLSTSRQILRSSLLPALFTGAVYFFWRIITPVDSVSPDGARRRARFWGLAALALLIGATLYTYVPARATWVVFPLFLVLQMVVLGQVSRRACGAAALAIGVGLLLSVPLFAYLWAHPGAEQRLGMVEAPLLSAGGLDGAAVLRHAASAIGGLLLPGRGDGFLAYNIPGRPVLLPWTASAFAAGLVLCGIRWRRPAAAFSLLWLLVGLLPSLVTGATAGMTRSIAALPVVYVFPAVALVGLARWAGRRWGSRGVRVAGAIAATVVVASGIVHSYDYFVRWARSPDTRAAYQVTVVRAADYLRERDVTGTVVLSSVYPQAPHDPYIFGLALNRPELPTRWVDARRALVLPGGPEALLIAPSSRRLDPYFATLAGLRLKEEVHLRPNDLDPGFEVYDWQPQLSRANLLARAKAPATDHQLPVDFGGAVELVGVDIVPDAIEPGEKLTLATTWAVVHPDRLREPGSSDDLVEAVLFTHALGPNNAILAQEDRLDAPPWDWEPGDTIVQLHRLDLPDDPSLGTILLEIGVYRPRDLSRIPVVVGGQAVADRVLIGPLDVEREGVD